MSDKETIIRIRKELYEYLSISYKSCVSLGSEVKNNTSLKSKYISMLSNYHHMVKYYTKVNSSTSINDIRNIREEIKNEISQIRNKYNELKKEYEELKANKANKIEINRVVNEMNSIVNLNKMMNEFISKIDSYLKAKKVTTTHINAPLPTVEKPKIVKEEVKGKEEKKEQKDIPLYKDKDIIEFDKVNRTICDMKKSYYKLDIRSKEAITLRKKIYDWCKKREFIVDKICGYDGVNTLINMESIEDDICSKIDIPLKETYSLDSKSYNEKFDHLIDVISDLKFNGYNSKYYKGKKDNYREYNKILSEANKEYEDIIKSVSDISKSKDINKLSTDIISLLNIYNIDGDYIKFKDVNNGAMIGGERISLETYKEGINRIKSMIKEIKEYSNGVIKRNGGTINITFHNKKDEEEKILQNERGKLYDMFIKGKKKIKENNMNR